MAVPAINTNGWDLIAVAGQDALNTQLSKISPLRVGTTIPVPFFGINFNVGFDVQISAPQLKVKDGSGRMVDVLLAVTGGFTVNNTPTPLQQNLVLTVTTSLAQIEAEVNSTTDGSKTTYDLVIDFLSPNLIVDINVNMDPGGYGVMVQALKQVVRDYIAKHDRYQVASFDLANNPANAMLVPLIPHVADFAFVQDTVNPGRSNLLVLMNSVSLIKGNTVFPEPLLPPNENFMVVVSNKVFLQYYVLPSVIDKLKSQVKDPNAVQHQVDIHNLPQQYMYQISNTGNIALNMDHDPWLSSINAMIDTTQQALCLFMEAQADVTFLNIHVDAWDRSWQQFQVDANNNIKLVQVKEDKNSSTSLDWWEWLIAALTGGIQLLVVGIIFAIVQNNEPDLGGTFVSKSPGLVKWPNQQNVVLKKISLPNHVAMTLDVHF